MNSITQNQWLVSDEYYPTWWLEETELPGVLDALTHAQEYIAEGNDTSEYEAGFNKAIELIKGETK